MVRRPQTSTQLEALSRRLAESRREFGRAALLTRQRLDLPARLHASVRHHPGSWFAGSLVAGLLAALVLRRRKPARRPLRGARLAGFAGLIATLVKPVLARWLLDQFRSRP